MSQTLEQRLQYHPHPYAIRSDRKVLGRFNLITSKIDFADKIVWDLGCSGGYFSFQLASKAKKVIAVDADLEVIKRNKVLQKELGIDNIEFIHAPLSEDLLLSLEKPDVTLFLSVLHHLLASSHAYDWNKNHSDFFVEKLIQVINQKTEVLVFEIGYPNEGYDWCENLPNFGSNFDAFVIQEIFRGCFGVVDVCAPPIDIKWYNKSFTSKLSRAYKEDPLYIQRIKNFLKYDSRDVRKLYFGSKNES